MSSTTLATPDTQSVLDNARALIEEARRRHRRRRWWTAVAVVLLASCVGFVIARSSGGSGSGTSVELKHHSAARSSWCSPGPVSAVPGASVLPAGAHPDIDGLCGGLAVRGMTLWGSGPSAVNYLNGIDFPPPFLPTQLGLRGSLQQYWFTTAAGLAPGPSNFPPLPKSFLQSHPGPAEVFLRVLSYDNKRSPERLLASQFFTNESIDGSAGMAAVTHIHSGANGGWLIARSKNYGDYMDDYFLEGALGSRLIQVSVWGYHLTLDEARGIANATTGS